MQQTLRTGTVADSERLSELAFVSKASWGYDAAFMDACRAELSVTPSKLESPGYLVKVLENEAAILGFYILELKDGDTASLEALFVDPGHFSRGYGKTLFLDAVAEARLLGIKAIAIESDPFAASFYRHLGAREVGDVASASIPGRRLPLFSYVVT